MQYNKKTKHTTLSEQFKIIYQHCRERRITLIHKYMIAHFSDLIHTSTSIISGVVKLILCAKNFPS